MQLKFKRLIVLFLLQFFICQISHSQIELSHFDNAIYYSTEDGLSSSDIESMIEDKHGFLWIGTANSVTRFDGSQFTNCLLYTSPSPRD